MKIFMTMAETAEALGYSHDYFQSNWRMLCRSMRAPFPVNCHRRGHMRWRKADLESYAAGAFFDPPALPTTANNDTPAAQRATTLDDPIDWDRFFADRATAVLQH